MKRLGNKGFTLIELIATIVVLALVMGIGSYSITTIIQNAKEKDYDLFIKEVKNAVEGYYQECRYVNNNCKYEITLADLVKSGFLDGNSSNVDGTIKVINPRDNVDISSCKIKYQYKDGEIVVNAVSTSGSCPSSY